jgi:hypothetical protein
LGVTSHVHDSPLAVALAGRVASEYEVGEPFFNHRYV